MKTNVKMKPAKFFQNNLLFILMVWKIIKLNVWYLGFEDDESDDDVRDLDILTNEKLYAMLNTFFVDEYGVTIATSMSNISYELHNLNKNLGKLLKSKN